MKTIVYVDGLNLYYGSLRGTVFKWLDLYSLFCNCILEGAEVEQVRYYTAPAKDSSSDDPESPLRQQRYLRALKAYRGERIQIVQGFIARTTPVLRLAQPASGTAKVRVFQFTEKQTDVNLSSDLISDACHCRCQQAVICSNDTDLVGALVAVKRDHPDVLMGLVAPVRETRHVASALRNLTGWSKILCIEDLAHSQLPERIPGTQLSRPAQWSEGAGLADRPHFPTLVPPNVA